VLGAAALWLRDLTAEAALRRVDAAAPHIAAAGDAFAAALPRLDRVRTWLQALPAAEAPFRSPLDWAAFQLTTHGEAAAPPA
jgi:hypothetical protein